MTSSSSLITSVWNSTIPVQLNFHQQPPLYISLPRNSFLPLYLGQFQAYFDTDASWISYEGIPLKWNWPISLLYDQCDPATEVWQLTLNDTEYPSDYIMPYGGPDSLQSSWLNSLKEAAYVLNGSSKTIMSMSKAETDTFFGSISSRSPELFEKSFRKLVPHTASLMKSLPVKVHLPLHRMVQSSAKINRNTTIGQLLQSLIPDLFPSNLFYTFADPICQGIVLPIDVPAIDLYLVLKSCDAFLHVSVRMQQRRGDTVE